MCYEDPKSLEDKGAALAELQRLLESHTEAKAADEKELAGTLEVIASLHADCDWLAYPSQCPRTSASALAPAPEPVPSHQYSSSLLPPCGTIDMASFLLA